jgi:hypothetical protein
MDDDELVIAVPAWQKPRHAPKPSTKSDRRPRRARRHRWFFIFDLETTADAAQKLRVGCLRIAKDRELVQEALFYEHLDPAELELLTAYAAHHELPVLSIGEFREWFFHYGYRLRATIVGHNLTFDLPAIAVEHRPGRGRLGRVLPRDLAHQGRVTREHVSAEAAHQGPQQPRGADRVRINEQGRARRHESLAWPVP